MNQQELIYVAQETRSPLLQIADRTKVCTKCGERKPINGHFGTHCKSPDGYQPWCRECLSAYMKSYVRTLFCPKCKQKLPKSQFSRDNNRKNKLQLWCKDCHTEARKRLNATTQKSYPNIVPTVIPISVSEVHAALDILCESLKYYPTEPKPEKTE